MSRSGRHRARYRRNLRGKRSPSPPDTKPDTTLRRIPGLPGTPGHNRHSVSHALGYPRTPLRMTLDPPDTLGGNGLPCTLPQPCKPSHTPRSSTDRKPAPRKLPCTRFRPSGSLWSKPQRGSFRRLCRPSRTRHSEPGFSAYPHTLGRTSPTVPCRRKALQDTLGCCFRSPCLLCTSLRAAKGKLSSTATPRSASSNPQDPLCFSSWRVSSPFVRPPFDQAVLPSCRLYGFFRFHAQNSLCCSTFFSKNARFSLFSSLPLWPSLTASDCCRTTRSDPLFF